ncbi:MAG: sigma-70 family RNA polymerase sigma factor [Planctomycetes bacterium]|nr:sigma-70 family RNA polymerase sigma factor [Planctomycetota bacterium]
MPTPDERIDHDRGPASALARLSRSRDARAWSDLLESCGADIQSVARRLAGSAALADDAVQETLLQLRDQAGKFATTDADPDEAARRWILRVTANTSLQLLRSRRRAHARDHAAGIRHEHRQEERMRATEPRQQVERDETASFLRAALAHLPEASRAPLVLHYVVGLGFTEIAAELRVPVGTAKTRVHRALESLRRRLRPMAGALSVAAIAQRLGDLPLAGGPTPIPITDHLALLAAPARASLSGLPATGALAMTVKIALVCAATIAIGVIPSVLSQDAGPAPGPGVDANAQIPGDPSLVRKLPAIPTVFAKEISCSFNDAPFEDVIAFLRSIGPLNIVVDPDVVKAPPGTIDLIVDSMAIHHALSHVARLTGTTWTFSNQAIVFRKADPIREAALGEHGFDPASVDGRWLPGLLDRLDQRLTFDFQDTPFLDVVNFLRQVTGVNVVIDPRIPADGPHITLTVADMKLAHVLDIIMKMCGLHCEPRDGALHVDMIPAPGIVAAVRADPQGAQDLIMLAVGPDDRAQIGSEYRIHRDGKPIVSVRVERILIDMLACRVVAESWSSDGLQVQQGDIANRDGDMGMVMPSTPVSPTRDF